MKLFTTHCKPVLVHCTSYLRAWKQGLKWLIGAVRVLLRSCLWCMLSQPFDPQAYTWYWVWLQPGSKACSTRPSASQTSNPWHGNIFDWRARSPHSQTSYLKKYCTFTRLPFSCLFSYSLHNMMIYHLKDAEEVWWSINLLWFMSILYYEEYIWSLHEFVYVGKGKERNKVNPCSFI